MVAILAIIILVCLYFMCTSNNDQVQITGRNSRSIQVGNDLNIVDDVIEHTIDSLAD